MIGSQLVWNAQTSRELKSARIERHPALRTHRRVTRRAFTLMDILVSIAVISILIAMLLPAISKVRESTRKIICGSNMRQIGMGVSVFTQDHNERLPDSVFLPIPRQNTSSLPSPERMDTLRLSKQEFRLPDSKLWDGLGKLYGQEYVTAPSIFYCPSHRGNFMFENAADDWRRLDGENEIIANYLFRGTGPDGSRVLYNIGSTAALVTDTLRSYEDLNHEGGFNVLQAGLAVNWFEDIGDQIAQDILSRSNDDSIGYSVKNAWDLLDGYPDNDDDDGIGG
jgi:hypothetical protein